MKATLEIPDALYRRVKAKSAMAGRPVREIAIRLFGDWVEEPLAPVSEPSTSPGKLPAWFGVANSYAKKVKSHDMTSVRDSIGKARAKK
jgi:hypothetical protein